MHKLGELRSILRKYPGVVVAFSGGVDSSFLLKIAKDVLGDRVIAVTALSPLMPMSDIMYATKIARRLGVEHRIINLDTLSKKEIRKNLKTRCYYCKLILMQKLNSIAKKQDYVVIEGTSRSDLALHRPGIRALELLHIASPLLAVGLEKTEIRNAARRLGLPNWNTPSAACLASRIPYGQEITIERLKRIEKAETYLRRLRFTQVRVRDHYPIARIEIKTSEFQKAIREQKKIDHYFRGVGYRFVTLDLAGYHTGSFD